MPALAKCAAIRAPMVPAPRTATRRSVFMKDSSLEKDSQSSVANPGAPARMTSRAFSG